MAWIHYPVSYLPAADYASPDSHSITIKMKKEKEKK
jgi:hypothetical protein